MSVQGKIERATTLLNEGKPLVNAAVSGAILARESWHGTDAIHGNNARPRSAFDIRPEKKS
jgi:hypothetical protein